MVSVTPCACTPLNAGLVPQHAYSAHSAIRRSAYGQNHGCEDNADCSPMVVNVCLERDTEQPGMPPSP
jgi:hypothetical protein